MRAVQRLAVGLAILAGCLCLCSHETLSAGTESAAEKPVAEMAARRMLLPAQARFDLEKKGLQVLWSQALGQAVPGEELKALYAAKDLVILETTDANVAYLDARTGTWRSATSLKNSLSGPPVLGQRFLYLLSGGKVVAVDVGTGSVRNELPLRLGNSAPPVLYGDTLILGTADGKIVRFGLENGLHIWTRSAEGQVKERPAVRGKVVLAAAYKGNVVALEGEMGGLLWSWKPPEPAQLTSGVSLGPKGVYVGDDLGFVYYLDAETGMPIWKYPLGRPVLSCALLGNSKLFVSTYKSKGVCLEVEHSPAVLWTHPDAEKVIALGTDRAYCWTWNRSLCAISTDSGTEQWRLQMPSGWQAAAGEGKGAFYLFNRAGSILAVREWD